MSSFVSAFLAVLASELGDRTFIVTTILAMKHSRISVFLGAMTAAALMITISGIIGLSSSLISPALVHYLSVGLFFFFGLQMLYEGTDIQRLQRTAHPLFPNAGSNTSSSPSFPVSRSLFSPTAYVTHS